MLPPAISERAQAIAEARGLVTIGVPDAVPDLMPLFSQTLAEAHTRFQQTLLELRVDAMEAQREVMKTGAQDLSPSPQLKHPIERITCALASPSASPRVVEWVHVATCHL